MLKFFLEPYSCPTLRTGAIDILNWNLGEIFLAAVTRWRVLDFFRGNRRLCPWIKTTRHDQIVLQMRPSILMVIRDLRLTIFKLVYRTINASTGFGISLKMPREICVWFSFLRTWSRTFFVTRPVAVVVVVRLPRFLPGYRRWLLYWLRFYLLLRSPLKIILLHLFQSNN